MKCGIAKFVNETRKMKTRLTSQDTGRFPAATVSRPRCDHGELHPLCEVFHAVTGRSFHCSGLTAVDSPGTGGAPGRGELKASRARNGHERHPTTVAVTVEDESHVKRPSGHGESFPDDHEFSKLESKLVELWEKEQAFQEDGEKNLDNSKKSR